MRVPVALGLARTELRTARARSRGLVVAVALGAGLVVATVVLGETMQQQVESGSGVEFSRADLLVRSDQGLETGVDGGVSGTAGISARDAARMAELPGVVDTTQIVRAQAAVAVDDDVRGILLETVPEPGFVWQRIADGRYPRSGAEVALSQESLDQLGVRVGEQVALGTPAAGRAVFTVVGSVDVRGSLRYSSVTYGLVAEPVARSLAGIDGYNEVQLRFAPGVTGQDVVDEVNAEVPVGFPLLAVDAVAATEELYGAGVGVLAGLLTGFALVAGLVAGVVLATVVSASLPGRRRGLALLRVVGAGRAQVRHALVVELVLVAAAGGLLAVPLGVGLAAASLPLVGYLPGVPALSIEMLAVPPAALVGAPVGAVLLGVVAALVPAWRVSRVPPAAALRGEDSTARSTGKPWRTGALLAAAGVSVGALILAADTGHTLATALAGVVTTLAAVAVSPAVGRGLATLAVRVSARRHPVAELAAAQLRRFPGRVTVTGLAATLAATTLSLSWVAIGSIDAMAADRPSTDPGPTVMVGAYAGGSALPPGTMEELARIEGVAAALPVESAPVGLSGRAPSGSLGGARTTRISGNVTALAAVDLARVTDGRFPLDRVRADVAYLPASDIPPFADDATVTLSGPDSGRKLRVRYVDGLPFQALVAPSTLRAVGADGMPVATWLGLERGADRPEVLDDVRAVAVLAGGQPVSGSAPAQARVDQAIDLARGLATGMLVVSVLIAVTGAALTIRTSVRERAGELATLRLLGMDGADVRRLVATETWVMAAFSVALGLALGTLLGAAAVISTAQALGLATHVVVPVLPLALLGALQAAAVRLAVTGPLDQVSLISPAAALRAACTGGH